VEFDTNKTPLLRLGIFLELLVTTELSDV